MYYLDAFKYTYHKTVATWYTIDIFISRLECQFKHILKDILDVFLNSASDRF